MRIKDLIKAINESYEDDVKRTMRDSLIALKIQGITHIKLDQILKDFDQKGMKISRTELVDLLQGDSMIKDVTSDMVIFSSDQPEIENFDKQGQNDKIVSKLANKALDKRIGE